MRSRIAHWLGSLGAHPAFLGLASTELCERFALAGLKALLTLILLDHVLTAQGGAVLGLAFLRSHLEGMFGSLSDVAFASQIYGLANALLYLCVPLCGLLGDLAIGRERAVLIGGGLMVTGLLMTASLWLTLPGLFAFAIGVGAVKGNLAAQVSEVFETDAERRSGYALYLGFLNAGQIAGPLICGALAATLGWMFGLLAAAAGLIVGLVIYSSTASRRKTQVALRSHTNASVDPRGHKSLRALPLLMVVILAIFLCFAAYEQVYNIVVWWASQQVEMHVGQFDVPASWILALDGLLTLLWIAATEWAFRAARRRHWEIAELPRIIAGCAFCAAGYVVLALATVLSGNEPVSFMWLLAYLVLVDLAIVLVWPAGLSLITAQAPRALVGMLVGVFYLHGFFANLWVGASGAFYDRMPLPQFWALHAALAAGGGLLLLITGAPLSQLIRSRQAITTVA